MAKCKNCGFEAPINEWRMIEKEGVTTIPDEELQKYEEIWRKENATKNLTRDQKIAFEFGSFLFKILGKAGLMPWHSTNFACPKCGKTELEPN